MGGGVRTKLMDMWEGGSDDSQAGEREDGAAMIARIRLWWKRRTCEHWYRPCLFFGKPARMCDDCGIVEQLTTERFYAEFGRMPW